ncbi:Protein trichome birefringence-like [Melia azedarach]|nr:Protein trichome birefringence-like [Melia azedarach]
MFVSLFCILKRVSSEVKKWRPAGADRGFTFLQYNLTIAYHRTNLLARYGRWSANANGGKLEALGYKEGYRVDVDVPEGTWAKAPSFHDILIFNTGHWWWAPSKFDPVKSPMLFFETDQPIIPPLPPDVGLDMVLKHMIQYVEKTARPGLIKLFRTQSPRHFEGGDWDQGGSCKRLQPLSSEQVEELFSLENNGTNIETRLVNQHLFEALKGSDFRILDITHMSEFRADAHPSMAGGKKHDDCMHWCLPGITDTWNDLFVTLLNDIEVKT